MAYISDLISQIAFQEEISKAIDQLKQQLCELEKELRVLAKSKKLGLDLGKLLQLEDRIEELKQITAAKDPSALAKKWLQRNGGKDQPWSTAARLQKLFTEYSGLLKSRECIEKKLMQQEATPQGAYDLLQCKIAMGDVEERVRLKLNQLAQEIRMLEYGQASDELRKLYTDISTTLQQQSKERLQKAHAWSACSC